MILNPFNPIATLHGVLRMSLKMTALSVAIPLDLNLIARKHSHDLVNIFRENTPIDKNIAAPAWYAKSLGIGVWAVINPVERKGFAYPGALITGTGSRGVEGVPGFYGRFNRSWPGMSPNMGLRSVWMAASSTPMAHPKLFN